MSTEKSRLLSSPTITAIVFNGEGSLESATLSASLFTAEEVVRPSGADARKALEVIELWQAAEASVERDRKHMPPLSQVLHNSLVVTKGYQSSIVEVNSRFPSYPAGHLETKVTADYVLVTSAIPSDQHAALLQAPKTETTSTALATLQGPIKLWQEPKQAVHTIGFSLTPPQLEQADSHLVGVFPIELFK